MKVNEKTLLDWLGPKKFLPETIGVVNEVGCVNGLAWTSVGGELLQAEVAILDGAGKIELTGSLGDVMKEIRSYRCQPGSPDGGSVCD